MLVYGIRNKENGSLVYIGQTIRPLSHRWTQHLRDSNKLEYPLYRAFRKYGIEKFEVIELAKASNREELNQMEIEFINKFNTLTPNGYNLMLGQSGGEHSAETKQKIRLAAINNGFGKWKRSDEDNLKNRERVLNQHSDPAKRLNHLIGNGSREFNVFEAILVQHRRPGRPAIYEKGKFIGTWLCATDCAKDMNFNKRASAKISDCLNSKRKTHSGFIFECKEI